MGSFLAVAQGSVQPPYMVVLTTMVVKKKRAPIVLVGKGLHLIQEEYLLNPPLQWMK